MRHYLALLAVSLGALTAAYPFRAKCAGPMSSNSFPDLMTTAATVSGHGVIAVDTVLAVATPLTFSHGSTVTVTLPDERWGGGAMYASAGALSGWGTDPIVACTGGASFKDCQSNCGAGDSTVTWTAPSSGSPSTVTLMFLGNRGSVSGNARSGTLNKHTITLTLAPTAPPTQAPSTPTFAPSAPTAAPTTSPTLVPTAPTTAPSAPTAVPTASPSTPTGEPTSTPTHAPTTRAPSPDAAGQHAGSGGDGATVNRTGIIVLCVLGGAGVAALVALIVMLVIIGASVTSRRRRRSPMANADGNCEGSSPEAKSTPRRGAQRGVVEMSPEGFSTGDHNSSAPNFSLNPMGRQPQLAERALEREQPRQAETPAAAHSAPLARSTLRGRSVGASSRGSIPGTLGGSTAGIVSDVMFVSERRLADGLLCTRAEFIAHYGGTNEWDAAGEHRRSVTGWYSRAQFVAFYGGTAEWDNAEGAPRSGI